MKELTTKEADQVSGGIVPLLGVAVAAFAAGYQLGKDLAK